LKLLVVGHSYVTPFAQAKYAAMKRIDPSLQLRILTPPDIGHFSGRRAHERHVGLTAEETVTVLRCGGRTHMTYALHPARVLRVLRAFEPDHVHIEEDPYSVAGAEMVLLARRSAATISFFVWDNLNRIPRFPIRLLKKALADFALGSADLVVCGNREGERLMRGPKRFRGSTLVAPQVGLDPEAYVGPVDPAVRARLGITGDDVWIGCAGRLVPEKGLRTLSDALQTLRHLPWRLLVVGDGPMKEEIRDRWPQAFGDRVRCMDAVPHEAMPDILKCLDIFVLPSYGTPQWVEQFGLTLAQAMMAGVACVGSSSGAIPDVLAMTGEVFAERDPAALASALERLIRDPARRRHCASAGRAVALARYTNEAVAGIYLSAFRELRVARQRYAAGERRQRYIGDR
jgi:L-malate glycosyltransferase